MADALFRYLHLARQRDASWYRRVFLPRGAQPAGEEERLLRTLAIHVEVVARRVHIKRRNAVAPASHLASVAFSVAPEPRDPGGEKEPEVYAQEGTSSILACRICGGTGRFRCWACRGSGRAACSECFGQGTVAHGRCGGEGRLATWEVIHYTYDVETTRRVTGFPPGSPALGPAVESWAPHAGEPLTELDRAAVISRLGYDCPEIDGAIAEARKLQRAVEAEMQTPAHRCFSLTAAFQVVPISAYFFRNRAWRTDEQSWVVGRGEGAVELAPTEDPAKLLRQRVTWQEAAAWAALVGTAYAVGVPLWPVFGVAALRAIYVDPRLLAAAKASLRMNAQRLNRTPAVRTVAILGPEAETSLYAACLALVGSHAGRLEIIGRRSRAQIGRLIGEPDAAADARPVLVRVDGKDVVRIVRAEAPGMADDCMTVAGGSDGIVVLGDETGHAPSAEKLEEIRRAYVEEHDPGRDWRKVFEELWAPLRESLAPPMPMALLAPRPDSAKPPALAGPSSPADCTSPAAGT